MKFLKKLFVLSVLSLFLCGNAGKSPLLLSPEKALRIAAGTPEARALAAYRNGALSDCLSVKVMRSCDSQWVTCRDNAWVVEYLPSGHCPVKGDGRLGMYFVVDGTTGQIISRYPELEYFSDPRFCRDDADCLAVKDKESLQCLNFIAGPFYQPSPGPGGQSCRCFKGRCAGFGEK